MECSVKLLLFWETDFFNMNVQWFLYVCFFMVACVGTTPSVKDGESAFELKRYSIAQQLLQAEFKETKDKLNKGRIAFLIAESFRRVGKLEAAERWYQKAVELNYGEDAMFFQAYNHKQLGKYQLAKEEFIALSKLKPSESRYKQEVRSIEILSDWLTNYDSTAYRVRRLDMNSSGNDFYPVWIDENAFIFLSDRYEATGDEIYEWTGHKRTDVFMYDIHFKKVTPFTNNINTENNEGRVTSDTSGAIQIFTRCVKENDQSDIYCKLFQLKSNGIITEEEILPFIKSQHNYMHPVLSKDGRTLIFSAQLPNGIGNFDLWYSNLDKNGQWTAPKILSSRINTAGDERFPTLDNDTMYYASNYLNSMGGLDIFKTYIMQDGTWAPPQNMKPPINSGFDDFGYIPDHNYIAKQSDIVLAGYFSSNRNGNSNGDDIYWVEKKGVKKPPSKKEEVYEVYVDLYINGATYANPLDTDSEVIKRTPLQNAEINFTSNDKDTLYSTDIHGKISFKVQENQSYNFIIRADGYYTRPFRMLGSSFPQIENRKVSTYVESVDLQPIIKNEEIVLKNIYYDYDAYNIRKDARPTLDTLAIVLEYNPSLRIELGSHTDCRGDEAYNQELSQNRAQSAKQYLVLKGITASRIIPIGYGESRMIETCECSDCTEEEHQENRRTTFKIVD